MEWRCSDHPWRSTRLHLQRTSDKLNPHIVLTLNQVHVLREITNPYSQELRRSHIRGNLVNDGISKILIQGATSLFKLATNFLDSERQVHSTTFATVHSEVHPTRHPRKPDHQNDNFPRESKARQLMIQTVGSFRIIGWLVKYLSSTTASRFLLSPSLSLAFYLACSSSPRSFNSLHVEFLSMSIIELTETWRYW